MQPSIMNGRCLRLKTYDYYSLENLPDAIEEVMKRMKESTQPIINTCVHHAYFE